MTITITMCPEFFSCPLCAHPSFNSLNSLRIGLVSVATRPLSCPICNDTVLGLDKLTIHLFGHTISESKPKTPEIPHLEMSPIHEEENFIPTEFLAFPITMNEDLRGKSVSSDLSHQGVVDNQNEEARAENSALEIPDQHKIENLAIQDAITMKKSEESTNIPTLVNAQDTANAGSHNAETLAKMRERCNICGLSLANRNSLILHKQLAHKIGSGDGTIRPEDLLKNYPCHLCSKVFKMRGSLMIHMRVAHTGGNLATLGDEQTKEGGFNCPLCGKNFKKEQHVTQHLKTHEGKQWECDICSKMFTTKYFLKKHKRLHSGEMPYQCNICGKTFTFQQSYHKHRLYHKDDKPHTCTSCGRSFKELSTLHNHERIHTGEKPFACETCGKCFRQRVSYLVHRRIHTGVMPYTCSACGKSFRYKVSQRTHKCTGQSEQPGQCQRLINDLNCGENQLNAFVPVSLDQVNKFVVIPDSNGEPTLTREIDIDPLKSQDLFHFPSEAQKSEEKICSDSQDFFSLVMSPMNDPSSPSTEMQHLRLASPKNEQTEEFPEAEDLQKELKHAIDGILNDRNRENSDLGTINEESLKELLYGIDKAL